MILPLIFATSEKERNYSSKIQTTMETKKLHFETLQLHVGQEQPDPATDARAVPLGKQHSDTLPVPEP